MHYVIKPVVTQHRTNLSHAQRTSPLFSETPVVLGKTLRRGQSMVISEEQMKANEAHLKRMVDAGSITVKAELSAEEKEALHKQLTVPPSDPTPPEDPPSTEPPAVEPPATETPVVSQDEKSVVEELDEAGKQGTTEEIVTSTPVAVEDAVTVKTGKKGKKG